MFTGIIAAVGTLGSMQRRGADAHIEIDTDKLDLSDVRIGDSIAVDGVCLSVVELTGKGFRADLSAETLARTTFGEAVEGARVNLEKALLVDARLGGHMVSGHVDSIGMVTGRETVGLSLNVSITAPDTLARYIATKGSICVNGVSLTVNSVRGATFTVNLVPHTLRETNLGNASVGHPVNLEIDIIARYLERLLLGERAADSVS